MISRIRFAKLALLGAGIVLAGTFLSCDHRDESGPDRTPTPEARRLAREKCDQAARIFHSDEGDVANLRDALVLFQEAVARDPELVEAHVGIGGVYRAGVHYGWFPQTPSLEKAEASFERALELDPTHMPAYVGLIRVHFNRGDPEAILRVGDRVRRTPGSAPEIRMTRAWAYFLAGMPDLALDLISNPGITDPPDDPGRQFLRTISHAWAGEYEDAIREGRRFVEAFGEEAEMRLWIATSYHCLGDLQRARSHYERSLELFGNNPNNYASVFAAICYEDLGLPEEAQRVLREARIVMENRLAMVEDNDRIQYQLEAHRVFMGEPVEPKSPFRQRPLLVCALAHQGRTEDAVRVIDGMESGLILLRSLALALGFRDIDAPVYREALERLEAREARLRELYGPL